MTAAIYNLSLEQGVTFRHSITWKTRDTQTNTESIVELTGCTARLQFRDIRNSTSPVLEVSTIPSASGSITLTAAGGKIEIYIPHTSVPSGIGLYDLEVTLANGDIKRLLSGKYSTSSEVTR